MLIRLKEANLYPGTRMILLKFFSLSGYEHVMDYIGRYIENYRERDYNLIQASSVSNDIYATLHFYTSEAMKKFWKEHISVYGEQQVVMAYSSEEVKLPSTTIYFEIPESEGIRGGKIPLLGEYRFEKYDRVLNAKAIFIDENEREEKKNMYLEIIDGRRNGKETAKELLNLIYGTSQMTNDLIPAMIRSVQINERKGVTTIVWKNGAVTMAKCGPHEEFDPEKGIAICIMKRFFSSTTKMNKWLKEQTKDYYERTFENGFEDEERLSLKDLVENFIKNA